MPVRPAAIATVLGTLAFVAFGTFADGTDGANADADGVRRHRRPRGRARSPDVPLRRPSRAPLGSHRQPGLGLAIASLPFVLVFWSGIAPVLAVSGMLLGSAARRTGDGPGKGAAAVGLGALALLGYVAIYVSDWMATNNIAGM